MKQFDLEKIVAYPTWREMLTDIMLKENIDPWDIDIAKITAKYIESIKEMKTLEFHIPANIVLAAAILLRLKSQTLVFEEEVQEVVGETYVDEEPMEIPVLELRTRIPPKRRITWDELVSALEDAFQEERKRSERSADRMVIPTKIRVELPQITLDDQIREIKKRITKTLDAEKMTTFSSLLDKKNKNVREEKIEVFLPLIFMFQKGEVSLVQEKMFDEIFVRITDRWSDGS